jgi:hypothetical protein
MDRDGWHLLVSGIGRLSRGVRASTSLFDEGLNKAKSKIAPRHVLSYVLYRDRPIRSKFDVKHESFL